MNEKKAHPLTAQLRPVSAAASAGIMIVELDTIQREAALKMPRKHALLELHRALHAKIEAALLHTITHELGHVPDEHEVANGQIGVERCQEPGFEKGDIYTYLDVPILYAGPIELGGQDDEMSARRDLCILNDAPHIDLSKVGIAANDD